MVRYWNANDDRSLRRDRLGLPDYSWLREPGPFGRFIKAAELPDERTFLFDVRDFQRFDDETVELSLSADDLGPEWDAALAKFFKMGDIAYE